MTSAGKTTARATAATLTALAAAMLLPTAPANGDEIKLTGVIRDFKIDHPDMQYEHKSFGVRKNLVLPTLDVSGKPSLNTNVDYARGMIAGPDSFRQWFRDVPGTNITIPYAITLTNGQDAPGGVYRFVVERPDYFFPIDGQGWNDTNLDKYDRQRNFYFTFELQTTFTYTDPMTRDEPLVFTFTGDDDVWVYINGHLTVDLGGVHAQAQASINLDQMAETIGLKAGEVYPLAFFFAERHTTESNFRMETTLQLVEVKPTTVSPLYD